MKLREYQVPHAKTGFQILTSNRSLLDASDTGTGKTYSILAMCKVKRVVPLIIAPKSVLPTWERVAAGLGTEIMCLNYERARGSRAKKGARVMDGRRYALSDLGEEKPYGVGSYWKWNHEVDTCVFDEAHLCCGTTTLNSKMMIAAKRQFGHVIMLSATIADSPLHLKAPGFVLGLHSLKDYRDFLWRHNCKPDFMGQFQFLDEPGELQKLHQELFPTKATRLRKKDIPGFPKSQIDVRLIDSDETTRKMAQKALDTRLEAGVTGSEFQALELKLVPVMVDTARLYQETSRVVLFVTHRESAARIAEALECPIIWGEQTAVERQDIIDRFQGNDLPCLVCTYGAGQMSISLHDPTGAVDRTTLLAPNFDARAVSQALGRVHRDGGAFSQQFLLALKGTYQEEVLEALAAKCNRMDVINDGDLVYAK